MSQPNAFPSNLKMELEPFIGPWRWIPGFLLIHYHTRIFLGHLKTRSLLRIMFEQGLIKKEWLTDYDEYKEYYDVIPYEAIDKQLHPFKVIENNAIYTACEHLVKLYDTDPDLFE